VSDGEGRVIDLIADAGERIVPYEDGRVQGLMNGRPSRRALPLKVRHRLNPGRASIPPAARISARRARLPAALAVAVCRSRKTPGLPSALLPSRFKSTTVLSNRELLVRASALRTIDLYDRRP